MDNEILIDDVKPVTTQTEAISDADLKLINDATTKKASALTVARQAALEAKNAELEHQVIVQHIFLKYNLKMVDSINDIGVIIRKEEA